ncbi:Na+/H+ antiporter subunit A [Trueperella sp. LYQ143]|uniref:Na+/H+ antiporter subunit A n=1 Tax=Trueperella sp. LYQ143 TaxID=3391059 RepID=UPI00398356C1
MLTLLAAFAGGAFGAPILMRRGRLGYLILALIPAFAFCYLLSFAPAVIHGNLSYSAWHWVPQLHLILSFRLDALSWVMALLVTGIGALVLAYCARYFSPTASGMGRFAAIFLSFAGAMLGLVTTDNTLALYLFWELTSVFSFILIGHNHDKRNSRRAAMQAFIVTTAGGLAMLAGIITLGSIPGGSYSLTELISAAQSGALGVAPITAHSVPPIVISGAVVAILCGALSKSAVIPVHFWLPGAMAAPTPTSAYLHAAAMVKAGVYLIARLSPAFSDVPAWRYIVLIGGIGTLLLGGYRALKQYDLKLVLAFGTVSQLGLIMLMVGYGTSAMLLAGMSMLVAHALFKSTLFLAVGHVDWATGTRDLRKLSGVGRRMPITAIAAGLGVCSMMGIPGFAGFVAKEAALHALVEPQLRPDGTDLLAIFTCVAIALGSALTVGYALRFWWGAFMSKADCECEAGNVKPHSWVMTLPIVILSLGGVVFGLAPNILERVLGSHARLIAGNPGHLSAWAGFGVPLAISVGILSAGCGLFAIRSVFARLTGRHNFPLDAEDTYHALISRLDALSGRVTAVTQRGSLPAYLSTIFTFTALAAFFALLFGDLHVPLRLRPYDTLAQAICAALTLLAAILAARARHRLKAVLMMGISGYGVAFTYELYGAPDLALTQALVETMTLVVFILVLRRLPQYFSNRPLRISRWWRIGLAVIFGLMTTIVAVLAAGARIHEPISAAFHDEAYAYGYGKNIVNVTLVDVRAWDTFGEMSVVVACAIGISSLLFIRDRSGRVDRFRNLTAPRTSVAGQIVRPMRDNGGPTWRRSQTRRIESAVTAPARNRRWLAGTDSVDFANRSVILEVGTRLIFHTIVVVSVFFLFSGHNQPGGGFAGGLLAGIALVLRYVAGGRYELGATLPLHPGHLMGTGMITAGMAAMIPVLLGGTILQSAKIDFVLPGFGHVHLATAIFFDIGVYLVVIGLILDILRSLGAEIDRHGEIEGLKVKEYQLSPAQDSRRDDTDAEVSRSMSDDEGTPDDLLVANATGQDRISGEDVEHTRAYLGQTRQEER